MKFLILTISILLLPGLALADNAFELGESSVSLSEEMPGIMAITIDGGSAELLYNNLDAKEFMQSSNESGSYKNFVKNAKHIACKRTAVQTNHGLEQTFNCLNIMSTKGVYQNNMNVSGNN